MDDAYQVYVNRVARMTLPEAYQSQAQHVQPSPKFKLSPAGTAQAAPFPGYTIITPPWVDDSHNAPFYQQLQTYQQQLLDRLSNWVVPVPPDSFHVTMADLIWESAYTHAIEDPTFEPKLQQCVAQSFNKCQATAKSETTQSETTQSETSQSDKPIAWQTLGLFLRTRAIGICLVPRDEDSYERIVSFRRTLYQNPELMALGIEQQYNFTAHITFGYFSEAIVQADRDQLAKVLIDLNQEWLDRDMPQMEIQQVELRKFDDMTRYYRQPDWPVLEF